ncbi:hypothetical protein [Sporosarcina highlanderae]|uniref:Uncharacterized protein n=1 Tax=Sporosarcina highlanderae TaxID=3035916 RepID=A0ABT8JVD2_9BACL|nr:hypothetical protein [Sporosarcina highlanderae]MDN4609105.1 hypothetical protein [Sporosarcina highlanderae]
MRLNLTIGECSLIYSSLKSEHRHLIGLQSEEKWVVERITEIEDLIGKLDSV